MFAAIRRTLLNNLAAESRFGSHPFRMGIELRSNIKPELGELQVGLAHFVHVRVAGPSERLFGHGTVSAAVFTELLCVVWPQRTPSIALPKRRPRRPHVGA